MRLLLIEDDAVVSRSIELMLKSESFSVYTTDLALQLRILRVSESMGDHDSEIMDGRFYRDDAGALGVLAA